MGWDIGSRVGLIAVANGGYASPAVACANWLIFLLEKYASPESTNRLPNEIHDIQRSVESLIWNWNNSIANEIFADNMDLDHPLSYRQSEIVDQHTKFGGFLDNRIVTDTKSDSPSNLSWKLSGQQRALAIEIRLTLTPPAKMQLLGVSAADLLLAHCFSRCRQVEGSILLTRGCFAVPAWPLTGASMRLPPGARRVMTASSSIAFNWCASSQRPSRLAAPQPGPDGRTILAVGSRHHCLRPGTEPI